MNTQDIISRIIQELLQMPGLKDKAARGTIANSTTDGTVVATDNQYADFKAIIDTAIAMETLTNGKIALDVLEIAIHPYIPAATGKGLILQALFNDLKMELNRVKNTNTNNNILIEQINEETNQFLADNIPFTNHEDLIKSIFDNNAPEFIIIDAPAGYGKTRILETLQENFNETGYRTISIKTRNITNILELVMKICSEIGIDVNLILDGKYDVRSTPNRLAYRIYQKFFRGKKRKYPGGLAFLFDDLGDNNSSLVEDLVEGFIPSFEKGLRTNTFFKNEPTRFRIIYTCRSRPIVFGNSNPRRKIEFLKPFTHDVIYRTALQVLEEQDPEKLEQIAAHILYLTGGHPACVANIIVSHAQDISLASSDFSDVMSSQIWNNIVGPQIYQIESSIPHELRDIFDKLSLYRFFNAKILGILLNNGYITYDSGKDCYDLCDALTETGLYRRQERLLKDATTRRMLALRLRHSLGEGLSEQCLQANSIYMKLLQDTNPQNKERWVIEALYQFLHQFSLEITNLDVRNRVRDQFFGTVLGQVIRHFFTNYDDRKTDLSDLLEKMDDDWEFQFTVNYYMSNGQYDTTTYANLKSSIREWAHNKSNYKGESNV